MGDNEMKTMADALWSYFADKYMIPYLSDSVCYFNAVVTSAPNGTTIGVQRPFDNEINLPYAWSAETLTVGAQCIVIVFGDMSNAIVIGDGTLSLPGNVPTPYTLNPAMDGTASPGTSTRYSRGNHVHPTDTSRAPTNHADALPTYGVGNGTYYGHLRLSDSATSTSGTNDGIAATPKAVKSVYESIPKAYTSNPAMDGTADPGSSTQWARGDHVHPTDTTRAPVASPAFTGTPTAPTAAAGTSSTQIATTAFVQGATAKYVDEIVLWIYQPDGDYYYVNYPASTHGKGTTPNVDVYIKDGNYYYKYYGTPSHFWRIRVEETTGDVMIISSQIFFGRVIIT